MRSEATLNPVSKQRRGGLRLWRVHCAQPADRRRNLSAHKDPRGIGRQGRFAVPLLLDTLLPITVPLEALRIAHATVDILNASASRISLSFATHLSRDDSAGMASIASPDAVLIARELIGALTDMATAFTIAHVRDASPALRQVVVTPVLREAVGRSFNRALKASLRGDGQTLTYNAWAALLESYLEVPLGSLR